jgi:hypothetical protein
MIAKNDYDNDFSFFVFNGKTHITQGKASEK